MENESLDLTAWRCSWKGAAMALQKCDDVEETGRRFAKALHKGLREFSKDLLNFNLDLSQFVNSIDDMGRIQDLVRQCKNHNYAEMFCKAASLGESRDIVLRKWLRFILDRVTSQVQIRAVPRSYGTLPEFREARDRLNEQIRPDVDRLARLLAKNPGKVPRARPRKTPTLPTINDQGSKSLIFRVEGRHV